MPCREGKGTCMILYLIAILCILIVLLSAVVVHMLFVAPRSLRPQRPLIRRSLIKRKTLDEILFE